MAAKTGRKQKPYETSWGQIVPGLARQSNDGRWRVVATGERYTEPDERLAVRLYQEKYAPKAELVQVPVLEPGQAQTNDEVNRILAYRAETVIGPDGNVATVRWAHPSALWGWFRVMLLKKPEYAAKMTGIPELANFRYMPLPRPSLKLSEIINVYRKQNPSTEKAKKEAVAPLQKLIDHAGAKTLDDLTTEKLLSFRQTIENSPTLKSAATRRGYFGRIKNIIAFGLKVGLDPLQIRSALDRCKVLWTAAPMPNVEPRPISREHFHVLLNAADDGQWRAWLLVGLNLCLHIEEVCALRWRDLDLVAGTHAAIREKTRRKRIPRAAVLWPETIEVLKKVPRRGPFVFISSHGTRYNKNTRVNDFREFRQDANLPDSVTFDSLRDGAYTAACQGTSDERQAKVLAGHSAGMQDNYVLRNPSFTRDACDAVYRVYGPFPIESAAEG